MPLNHAYYFFKYSLLNQQYYLPGLLRTANGEEVVAIKVLKESAGRSAEEDFVREVSIMSAFRHPNILTLVGVVYRGQCSISTVLPDVFIMFLIIV